MEFIVHFIVLIMVNLYDSCFALRPVDILGGATTLKEHLARDLGMKHIPDIKKANLTMHEYSRMREIYEKTLEQANEIKRLRNQFKSIHHSIASKQSVQFSELRYRVDDFPTFKPSAILTFPVGEILPDYGLIMVKRAKLVMNIKKRYSDSEKSFKVELIQLVDEIDGITIDTSDANEDEENTFEFDVTDTVQAWVENPNTNLGFKLSVGDFEIDNSEEFAPKIEMDYEFAFIRHKRSLFEGLKENENERTDCSKKDNRCCRDDMKVNLRELEGFSFIIEPKEFNAYQCRGKCPPRFRPLNDHSLLQSLMHIKHQKNAVESSSRNRIKKPCCVPSKLSGLPILHLDEDNPSKLKVTTWKSIVVTECACG